MLSTSNKSSSSTALNEMPEGPARGGWFYGSFKSNSDEGMRTLRGSTVKKSTSFSSTLRKSSSKETISFAQPTSATGKFSMLEFSMMYFRQNIERYEAISSHAGDVKDTIQKIENLKINTSTLKKRFIRKESKEKLQNESWSWKEQAEAIKWTSEPISRSLLKLPTEEMSADAVNCFKNILIFMGNSQENASEVESVYPIMKACHHQPELRDEVYCQLAKQTTNNKSTEPSSCVKGWRLFTLFSCWFACSEILKPYLLHYIQQNASDPSRTHQPTASTCLSALRKTLKHGGRRNIPTTEEISAFAEGKFSKRLKVHLSGNDDLAVILLPYTLVKDVLEDICTKLGIISQSEVEEYALFVVCDSEPSFRLRREEYILDILSQMKMHHVTCKVYLERICWYHEIHYDLISDQCISLLYSQIEELYLGGWLMCLPEHVKKIPNKMQEDIIRIASLLWRISQNNDEDLNLNTCGHFVPDIVVASGLLDKDQVLTGMLHYLSSMPVCAAADIISTKIDLMEILKRWPMFGASFYQVRCDSDPKFNGACIFAINRAGIHFLHDKTHRVILSYLFTDVISTRRSVTDFSDALDIKVGNNMVQKVLRLETPQAADIIYQIGQYVKVLNSFKNHSM